MFGDVGFGVDRPLICLRRLSAPDSAHSVFGCIAVRRSAHGPVLGLRMGGALGFGLYRPHPATGWRQVISGSRPLRTRCRPLASGLPWRITTHSSRTRFAGRLNSRRYAAVRCWCRSFFLRIHRGSVSGRLQVAAHYSFRCWSACCFANVVSCVVLRLSVASVASRVMGSRQSPKSPVGGRVLALGGGPASGALPHNNSFKPKPLRGSA